MAKRNVDSMADVATENTRPRKRLNQSCIDATVAESRKTLHRALKLAKGFERQKLSRRQRAAQTAGDEAELGRINAEIEAWKSLNAGQVANGYLAKIVTRTKSLSVVQELVDSTSLPSRATNDAATLNVTARLYNAKPVKAAVTVILAGLYDCAGVSGGKKPPRTAEVHSSEIEGPETTAGLESRASVATAGTGDPGSASAMQATGSLPDRSRGVVGNADTQDPDSVDESDISALEEQYSSRLAPGSDDEDSEDVAYPLAGDLNRSNDEWSGSEDGDEMLAGEPGSSNDEWSGFGSESSSISRDQATSPGVARENRTRPLAGFVPAKPTRSSAAVQADSNYFLPALNTVGYLSGSDSGSDAESLADDEPRKRNRRGQRARQKILEQKFGKQAKHLNKPKKGKDGRDEGWDLKKGAKGQRGKRRAKDGGRGRGGKGATGATGANTEMVTNRLAKTATAKTQSHPARAPGPGPKRDDLGALHPSWVAKKNAKEATLAAPFQGTKVTFD